MKPLEILSSIPQWASAAPDAILASPAWAMQCRLGDTPCVMRLGATRPAEAISLDILLESETHVLSIADSPNFSELHTVWPSRADVPEPILLALVENECGPLLQLIENAVRLQLKIVGISKAPLSPDATCAQISSTEGKELAVFTLDASQKVVAALGQLRNIDLAHESVRDAMLPAETEYATFAIPSADLSSLAQGDALLVPEIDTLPPRFIVDGRFSLSDNGVAPWKDEGMLRICSAESTPTPVGALLDAAGGSAPQNAPTLLENAPLKLMRMGKTLAIGHFSKIAGQSAFIAETVNP